MQRLFLVFAAVAGVFVPAGVRGDDPPKFEWRDGDRVVMIGDDLIERDQKYGYLETFVTIQNPHKTIIFRNLGWSGDTPWGIARARFGTQADGFQHLKDHVLALKPTVVIVGYGMTDSFDGAEGLPRFREGMNTLLDALAPTKARFVLLSPIAHEDLGRPLPDPTRHNEALRLYAGAVGDIAKARGAWFVDLFDLSPTYSTDDARHSLAGRPRTDDGIHLNATGYRIVALTIGRRLADAPLGPPTLAKKGRSPRGLRFEMTESTLPLPGFNDGLGQVGLVTLGRLALTDAELPDGRYLLWIDGRPTARASAEDWKKTSVPCTSYPGVSQREQLRQTIVEKNRLYFYRWRPQNETYLFGFRKHEQGNNAGEIPLFDPLVEEKEKEIARSRVPVSHVYELTREGEESK